MSTTYTYSILDAPSATNTVAYRINNSGQVVGISSNASGNNGFLYNDGTYTTIDDPSAVGFNGTFAYGINDNGQIVGSYWAAAPEAVFYIALAPIQHWTNRRCLRHKRQGPDRRHLYRCQWQPRVLIQRWHLHGAE